MATTFNVKNSDGSAGESIPGSEKLFGAKINTGLIYQAVQVETTNSRQGTQSTKTRSEVHHTTRKPYKQKGTGRARQGMTSAPHYRHGGIAFGPKPRDLVRTMPKKMRRAAIASALSAKAESNAIVVTDAISFDSISTKAAVALLRKLELPQGKIMLVLPEHSSVIYKSFRNIPNIAVRFAPSFSTRDIIDAKTIVFTRDALAKIESVWSGDGAAAEGVQS